MNETPTRFSRICKICKRAYSYALNDPIIAKQCCEERSEPESEINFSSLLPWIIWSFKLLKRSPRRAIKSRRHY